MVKEPLSGGNGAAGCRKIISLQGDSGAVEWLAKGDAA